MLNEYKNHTLCRTAEYYHAGVVHSWLEGEETVNWKIWKILEFTMQTKIMSLSSNGGPTSGFSELPLFYVLRKQNYIALCLFFHFQ